MTLPSSEYELTPEWITHALELAGVVMSGRVASVTTTTLGASTGLMSRIVRLSLSYQSDESEAPSTLIAKFPPENPESRRIGVDFGVFEGECSFYQHLAQASEVPAPRCYFTRFEPDSGGFLTLLQDLSSARLGDISRGCTRDEGIDAVRILARLHASWWNSTTVSDHAWLRTRRGRLADLIPMMSLAWPTFTSRFEGALGPEQIAILSSVQDMVSGSYDTLVAGPETLLHGDYKLDNMFFHDSGELTVADWGLIMMGPPMFDVATFLGVDFSVAERREREVGLIQAYVQSLREGGVGDYEFDQAWRDYRLQLFGLLPQLICAGGLAEFVDASAMEGYAAGVQRVIAAVADHGAIDLLSA